MFGATVCSSMTTSLKAGAVEAVPWAEHSLSQVGREGLAGVFWGASNRLALSLSCRDL
jgi:hypothetical protein